MFKNAFNSCQVKEVTLESRESGYNHVATMTCPRLDDLGCKPQNVIEKDNRNNYRARAKALTLLSKSVTQRFCAHCPYDKAQVESLTDVATVRADAAKDRITAMKIEQATLRDEMQTVSSLGATKIEHAQVMSSIESTEN